jgi:zinc/manganese transport system permease protein
MIDVMLPPFVACLLLVAILSYLGLHVIAREVIFVDLSLAQVAAFGSITAPLIGHLVGFTATPAAAYGFALTFTALAAALFAVTRRSPQGGVPQEAIIGIVYVVASAATILAAANFPGGSEQVEKSLVGSILWVSWPSILRLAGAFLLLGVFHYLLRDRFLTVSFHPAEAERRGWSIRWLDFWFYLSLGIVITLVVPVGGVLMVFTFLVVPAAIAFLFTRNMRRLTTIAWTSGAVASALGLWLSFEWDLPTGPLIVCAYGALLALAASPSPRSGARR